MRTRYNDYISFLTSWCDGKERFIRDFGHPARVMSLDVSQLYKQIMYYCLNKKDSVYITVFGYRKVYDDPEKKHYSRKKLPDYETAIINKLYFEFDNDHMINGTLSNTYADVMKLRDAVGKPVRIYFTGGRGFHLYIDILSCITKAMLYSLTEDIVQSLHLQTSDVGHMGDVARVYRIPGFPHHKTGRFCIEVNGQMSLSEILDKSTVCSVPKPIVRRPILLEECYA